MSKTYNEKHISGFTRDLEKIQAKPTLYIGPTDAAGVYTILRECCDNAVDEARAGRNDLVNIVVDGDTFWVQDQGVGIPVKMHEKMKISTLTHVLTNLQSSGKMKGDAYKSAIGTHGVGIKATNALSSEFEVWTFRKDAGGWHHTRFEKGVEVKKVKKSDAPKVPGFGKAKFGTVVRFKPNEKVFKDAKINVKQLITWCEMTAYMNAGLTVQLSAAGKTKKWRSKDGIKAYLAKRIEALKATPLSKKHVYVNTNTIEAAICFADVEGSAVEFFTNTIRNIEEGVHADDMYKALVDSLKPFKGKLEYTPSDVREGLVGVFNYKINAPQFDSQTKEKLVDARVKGACYKETLEHFTKFFKENKSLAKELVKRAAELRKKTADFLKDKKLIKNVKAAHKGLAAKLADVTGSTPTDVRELYLVEGDSAGGTAKLARNKAFQATFAMRGKPLNVMDSTKDKINKNKEIAGILAGLGLELGQKNPLSKIRFGKIILLADPDVDGRHINCLLLAMLWKYLPSLFKDGRVFMVASPEYLARHKGEVLFGMTKEAIYKKAGTENVDIRHIKGWGEVSAENMQPLAFQIGKRRLYRVMPPRDKKGRLEFQALMGKDSSYRKKLLGVV